MFSASVSTLSGQAFAQSAPNTDTDTRQTDQSEEDWRKSQKKRGASTEDILDIIKNTRGSGVGNGRGYSPIDALPEESRRHLMKERAKRLAQAGPNEAVDVSYAPSEAAKSDPNLEADEKAAWEKMSRGMNGVTDSAQTSGSQNGQGQGSQGQGEQNQRSEGQGGSGQSPQSGQAGQPSGGASGQNGASDGSSGQSQTSPSVMRGGSAASVSDIMARIKGLNSGVGSSQKGSRDTGSQNTANSGKSLQNGTGSKASQTEASSSSGTSTQPSDQQQSGTQIASQTQSERQAPSNSSDTEENSPKIESISQGDGANASQQDASSTQPSREAISPLERIKKVNRERETSNSRSSASDYLGGKK